MLASDIQPNKLQLIECSLLNHSGEVYLDLRPNLIEFSIYESLFTPYVTGTIIYTDAAGIIETLPLLGDEIVHISFKSLARPDIRPSTYRFAAYKYSDRTRDEERAETFIIHLISPEVIVNMKAESNEGYVGKTISEIVLNEFDNHFYSNEYRWGRPSVNIRYLGGDRDSQPLEDAIDIEPSAGLHSFVGTKQRPFDFIKYLAQQAESDQYKESDFIFFRDNRRHRFVTISSLIKQEVSQSFYLANPNAENADTPPGVPQINRDQIILGVPEFKSSPDSILRMQSGLYENKQSTIDLITKRYVESDVFKYADDYKVSTDEFDGFTSLGSHSLLSPTSVHSNDSEPVLHRMFAIDSDYSTSSYINGKTGDPSVEFPRRKQNFVKEMTSKLAQVLHGNRIAFAVAGDNERTVGQIVNVFLPQNSTDPQMLRRYNLLLTGGAGREVQAKFLVVNVVHNYNRIEEEYYTRLEVTKDSYGSDPSSVDTRYAKKEQLSWT